MAYSSFDKQQAAHRRYSQTPQGREAKRRAAARYYAKKRMGELRVDPRPLAQVIADWRT